ncbi:helix-turn-helix transcriptional regulator [Actinoplanes sp. TBRC 11911]|uniref:ATP-binding protein n=1 Tax=Actinoplanes sp. TBRC 11911 TaxID=2729386 RepID=UPI00145DD797|nr:AAA family ATPase [Actinoplanes sp. TBRC 11911]NMO55523.1 helix-turn-helix transcriptional regulator [Actinoplanes sp. TBRC 11911]
MVIDRRAERAALDHLLTEVQTGRSGALVLRGEAGIGKSMLLDYVGGQAAAGGHIVRTAGVEAEQELPFAALHQVCVPMLDRLHHLPGPQRDALRTAFGLSAGDPPDRFLVGLAVLGLFAQLARDQPVVCLVDDAHWLDRASAQVLGFAARRLRAESVAMVFAVRGEPIDALAGLPEIVVSGLPEESARALLASSRLGPVDDRVLDRLIAESHGNPLALVELPRGFTPAELAGGFGLYDAEALPRRIEESYRRQIAGLAPQARQVLLVAAAEPTGDPVLVWRAVDRLGLDPDAEVAAALKAAGLVEFGSTVRFRHPLLRSAVYRSATAAEQRRAHAVLAEVIDPATDPDRRAWQRARAAPAPDEDIAAELEHGAQRARARGGPAAAAAFLERAAELTPEAKPRGERLLEAARAKHEAGLPHAALRLVAMADATPLDDLAHAHADLLRAHLTFALSRGRDSAALLVKAADRLAPLDPALARTTYLEAMRAAWYAADPGNSATLRDVADAVAAAPVPPGPAKPSDLLLDGLAVRYTAGFVAGAPKLQTAVQAFRELALAPGEALRWYWFACSAAIDLFDDAGADTLANGYVRLARRTGTVSALPLALTQLIVLRVFAGDLAEAGTLVAELQEIADGTGVHPPAYTAQMLAAWQGREKTTTELTALNAADAWRRGEGLGLVHSAWAKSVLCNGLGRYDEALHAARRATRPGPELGVLTWAPLVELIVAAAHSDATDGTAALDRLIEMTRACGTDWALGVEALGRALLGDSEPDYREAIDRLSRTRVRSLLARAHLYLGESLWDRDRRDEAREQFRTAHDLFAAMGMEAFTALAAAKLGGVARKRPDEPAGHQLTAQETQIVRLTREGLSNVEIAARLFISPRTVEWHLSKIFSKLGMTSRRQLRNLAPHPGGLSRG